MTRDWKGYLIIALLLFGYYQAWQWHEEHKADKAELREQIDQEKRWAHEQAQWAQSEATWVNGQINWAVKRVEEQTGDGVRSE